MALYANEFKNNIYMGIDGDGENLKIYPISLDEPIKMSDEELKTAKQFKIVPIRGIVEEQNDTK